MFCNPTQSLFWLLWFTLCIFETFIDKELLDDKVESWLWSPILLLLERSSSLCLPPRSGVAIDDCLFLELLARSEIQYNSLYSFPLQLKNSKQTYPHLEWFYNKINSIFQKPHEIWLHVAMSWSIEEVW